MQISSHSLKISAGLKKHKQLFVKIPSFSSVSIKYHLIILKSVCLGPYDRGCAVTFIVFGAENLCLGLIFEVLFRVFRQGRILWKI